MNKKILHQLVALVSDVETAPSLAVAVDRARGVRAALVRLLESAPPDPPAPGAVAEELLRIACVAGGCAHGAGECPSCARVASELLECALAIAVAHPDDRASLVATARVRAGRYAQSVRRRAATGGRPIVCACPAGGVHRMGCVLALRRPGRRTVGFRLTEYARRR